MILRKAMSHTVHAPNKGPRQRYLPYAGAVIRGLRISDLNGRRHPSDWDAFVDTGAGLTVVPVAACNALMLRKVGECDLYAFDGDSRGPHDLYYAQIVVQNLGSFKLMVAGVSIRYIILGRDFLSTAFFIYNGRKNHWSAECEGWLRHYAVRVTG